MSGFALKVVKTKGIPGISLTIQDLMATPIEKRTHLNIIEVELPPTSIRLIHHLSSSIVSIKFYHCPYSLVFSIMQGFPALKYLTLGNIENDDELINLLALTKLEELHLEANPNPLTDKWLVWLQTEGVAQGIKKVKIMERTLFTKKGLEAFRNSIKKVIIEGRRQKDKTKKDLEPFREERPELELELSYEPN